MNNLYYHYNHNMFYELPTDLFMKILQKRTELIISDNSKIITNKSKNNMISSIMYYNTNNKGIKKFRDLSKYELYKIMVNNNIKYYKKEQVDRLIYHNLLEKFDYL